MPSSSVWTGPVTGSHLGAQHFDQVAVEVVPAGTDDALEVEALFDSDFDCGADALVDAGADAFEPPELPGVAEAVVGQLLHPCRCDRALAGGESSLAVEPADVTGLVDEASVGLRAALPTGCKLGVGVGESSGGFEGDDALPRQLPHRPTRRPQGHPHQGLLTPRFAGISI